MFRGFFEGPRVFAGTREMMTPGDQPDGTNSNWFMELGNFGLVRHCDGPGQCDRLGAREARFSPRNLFKVIVGIARQTLRLTVGKRLDPEPPYTFENHFGAVR